MPPVFRLILPVLLLFGTFAAAEPARLVVIGDSLARQYCRGFKRLAEDRADLNVDCWVTPSSGLSRPDFHDWPKDVEAHLKADGAHIAVVAFGANDAQRVIHDGAALDFGTQGWLDLYAARVGAIMDLLRAADVETFWLGLPIVRSGEFDAKLQKLDAVYVERAGALGARYVDLRGMTAENGAYTANLADESGRLKRARDSDGVHFTRFAENLLSRRIMAVIEAQSARLTGG